MAIVNKQGGAEKHETQAGAGLDIDFDPEDPKVVKVHYDLSAWTFDQRAELSEALASVELPHAWDGEELMVPESVEDATDAMFEKLEAEMGPFPVGLESDAESTEFGLDEWTDADRKILTESLVESEIPHRWDGTTVVIAQDAEDAVDDLLDAIESGALMSADPDATGAQAPDGALSDIFLAANKLAKDPLDAKSRNTMIDMNEQIDAKHPPYAFAPRSWAQVVDGVGNIVERIMADADGDHVKDEAIDESGRLEQSSDVIGLARSLRELVRPFV